MKDNFSIRKNLDRILHVWNRIQIQIQIRHRDGLHDLGLLHLDHEIRHPYQQRFFVFLRLCALSRLQIFQTS